MPLDEAATQPEAETAYSEQDAATELLNRWKGRQDADTTESDEEREATAKPDTETEPEAEPEQPEGQAQEAEDTEETEWVVEFGGQERKLPKGIPESVAREIQEFGQSLTRDYTRKTQEIAEVRKQIDADRQAAQELTRLTHEHADLVADWRFTQREIDKITQQDLAALSESDPMAALKQQAMLVQLQQAQQRIGAQLQGSIAEMAARQQASAKEALERATAELAKDKDLKWSKETAAALTAYGKSLGFSDTELAQVSDPRVVRLLHKAQQYDALVASKPAVTKRVSEAPKVVKPNAAGSAQSIQRTQADEAMKRLDRTGTVDSAAQALLARMRSKGSRK